MEQAADTPIRIRTVRERTTFWSRLAGLVAVIVPPVGLVVGTVLLWGRGVNWVDLAVLVWRGAPGGLWRARGRDTGSAVAAGAVAVDSQREAGEAMSLPALPFSPDMIFNVSCTEMSRFHGVLWAGLWRRCGRWELKSAHQRMTVRRCVFVEAISTLLNTSCRWPAPR